MPGNPPTWRDLYTGACARLGSDFEARQLIGFVAGSDPVGLLLSANGTAPGSAARKLEELVQKRLAGAPLQYLLGEWEFYGLPFFVGPGVLIPRQDSERLVEAALDTLRSRAAPEPPEVLDLCSGSGCIAIAIAREFSTARVTAVENSADALPYLRRNRERNGVEVEVVQADLHHYTHPRPLDLITANPPYIPRADIGALQREVQAEPRGALDGGVDGLDFYRAIAQRYLVQLAPGGRLLCEVGAGQSEEVAAILRTNGYAGIQTLDDYTGIPRVVCASRPPNAAGTGRCDA